MNDLFLKAYKGEFLTLEEGVELYKNAKTSDLIFVANQIKNKIHKNNIVGWQIDRNINITNACVAQCKFCNFYVKPNSEKVYVTTIEEYKQKIDELYSLGGKQVLLQGGLHPKMGLEFYTKLFSDLKALYPDLKLHALGPAEIHHIAKFDKTTYKDVLEKLTKAGLDSLPGAGAEILVDRVRNIVSRGKCNSQQWLDVMREAHKLNISTSATMMFGHVETVEERIEHLVRIREVQSEKPENTDGFIAFIPWPFQDEGTNLQKESNVYSLISSEDYIRMIAISRLMLPNIKNIQASWLTVGSKTAQLCLHAGANDFGSIMIEENVVSVAGADYSFDAEGIQKSIIEAGFTPKLRNQKYEYLN
jgi:cyclic dehypoxanthinyl futalosine synthase